jgi:hypothetical protein
VLPSNPDPAADPPADAKLDDLKSTAQVNKLPLKSRFMTLLEHEVAALPAGSAFASWRVFDATYFLSPGGTGTAISPAPAWLGQPFDDADAPIDYARRLLEPGSVGQVEFIAF